MRILEAIGRLNWHAKSDFRAKATFGVASAALLLLLPVAFLNFYEGQIATGIGSLGIVSMLATAALMVTQDRCPQNLILFGLVPVGMIFMISVFNHDGLVGALWCYPSIIACYCMLSEKKAWMANLAILSISMPMVWLNLEVGYALRIFATLFAISVFSAILVSVIDSQRRQLQVQLTLDPLTGLLNRLSLQDELQKAADNHNSGGRQSSLLAIDIDFFKRINDDYGHDSGDHVLKELAMLLHNTLRVEDRCFRVGGEEFLILLADLPQENANGIAQRVRRNVENTQLHAHGTVTISVGVASHIQLESVSEWSKRCDQRLYAAKRQGRNCVVAHTPPTLSDVISLSHRTQPTES